MTVERGSGQAVRRTGRAARSIGKAEHRTAAIAIRQAEHRTAVIAIRQAAHRTGSRQVSTNVLTEHGAYPVKATTETIPVLTSSTPWTILS